MQTNADDASRTLLTLRAAECAKDQRQDRDSVVSTESSSDTVTTNVRSLFSPGSNSPSSVGDEITKVSSLLISYAVV